MKFRMNALQCAAVGVSLAIATTAANAVVMHDDTATLTSADQLTLTPTPQVRQVIVNYKNQLSNLQSTVDSVSMRSVATAAAGAEVEHLRQMDTGAHVFTFDESMSEEEFDLAVAKLSADPSIASVEEDTMMQIMAAPNDPDYNTQWLTMVQRTATSVPVPLLGCSQL